MAHTNVQLLSQFKSSLRGTLCYKLSRLVVCLLCLVEPSGSFFIYLFFPLLPYHMLFSVRDKCAVHLRKNFSRFFFSFFKLDHNYYLSKDLHLPCEIPCGREHIRSKNLLLQYGWDWITPHFALTVQSTELLLPNQHCPPIHSKLSWLADIEGKSGRLGSCLMRFMVLRTTD